MSSGYGHMAGMGLWGILLIVLLIAVVWAFFIAARRTGGGGFGHGPAESPSDIVKRRYATGEIDRETYERMLADLKK